MKDKWETEKKREKGRGSCYLPSWAAARAARSPNSGTQLNALILQEGETDEVSQ